MQWGTPGPLASLDVASERHHRSLKLRSVKVENLDVKVINILNSMRNCHETLSIVLQVVVYRCDCLWYNSEDSCTDGRQVGIVSVIVVI